MLAMAGGRVSAFATKARFEVPRDGATRLKRASHDFVYEFSDGPRFSVDSFIAGHLAKCLPGRQQWNAAHKDSYHVSSD